jgi:hypothetical protein
MLGVNQFILLTHDILCGHHARSETVYTLILMIIQWDWIIMLGVDLVYTLKTHDNPSADTMLGVNQFILLNS